MENSQKVGFAWNEPKPLLAVPDRLWFRSVAEDAMGILIDAVSRVMADSKDGSDRVLHGGFARATWERVCV